MRRRTVDQGLQAVIAALVVAYAGSLAWADRPPSGYVTLWDGWVLHLAIALPMVPVAIAARRQPARRLAWAMIGAGIALNATAELVYLLHDQNLSPVPFPAPSDVPYLLSYVGFGVGAVLLGRSGVRDPEPGSALDGLIAGLAIATLVGLVWFGPVLEVSGTVLEATVGLAYPILDLALITILVGNLIITRRRLDRSLVAMTVGVVCFVIGDTTYLSQVAADRYVPGTMLDLTWVIAIFCIGLAASLRPPDERRRHPRRRGRRPGALATPVTFGAMSTVALGIALAGDPGPVLSLMVVSLFLAVLARTWITLRALHRAEAASSRDAHTDFLTGLSNRRDLVERLEQLGADGPPAPGLVGMVLIDLDGFKEVNDSLGHLVGDELLRIVAARFERAVPPTAIVARLGGDEYACALRVDAVAELAATADALQAVVAEPIALDGMTVRVDASLGLAAARTEDLDVLELLRRADVAMYEAKRAHSGIRSYEPENDPNSRERLALVEDLRGAIERRELVLHYQPAIDLRTGRARGVEALVRWERPGAGLVMPDAFVPLAERFGLIPKLTRSVIEQAVEEIARLSTHGHEICISVNISGSDLVDEHLPTFVTEVLARCGVEPRLLTLEITESVLASDIDRAQRSIDRLRRDGILISIDDYGVGYSSMSQLLSLRVDELKIDKSFVLALESDERASAIVRSAVEFARALGLTVVAEGIETAEVLDRLQRLDVDVAQGYYLARPLTAEQLDGFLAAATEPAGQPPVATPNASNRAARTASSLPAGDSDSTTITRSCSGTTLIDWPLKPLA